MLLVAAAMGASLPAHPAHPAPPTPPGAATWPQWLGPTRDGRTDAPGTFAGRGVVTLRVAWRKPLDAGLASLTVAGGRIFTVATDGESDYAVALSAQDGTEQWRASLDPSVAVLERGPVSTPAVDGALVYVLSAACRLRALDAADGRVAWTRDLKADFGVELRQGCHTSPLLEAGQLLVQAGGRENDRPLLAFDAKSGQPAWTARGAQRTFYTSPVVADWPGHAR